MKRSASAVWKGGLQDGRGTVSTDSGVISNTPYNFKMRFENEKGTNPEELVAAAHAACFSMALSLFLGQAGMTAGQHRDEGDGQPGSGRRRLRGDIEPPGHEGEDSQRR
jgi:osmotically inducible protein OsmC